MANYTSRTYLRLGMVLLLSLCAVGAVGFFLFGGPKHSPRASAGEGGEQDPEQSVISVRAVKPRFDKTFTMTERRPADVQAYYRADLETRVPGVVSMIKTDVGDVVKRGETLVEVSVPDLRAKEAEQKAAYSLAEAQVDQKKAAVKTAESEVESAKARIRSSEAKLRSDIAYRTFRERQAERYKELLRDRSIDARLVDEQEDRREAAVEAVNASRESVETAKAQKTAAEARVEQAQADLAEAREKVKVAKAAWDFATAMLEYATVKSPFDGTVVRRNVDPGFFVQDAAHGQATPLVTIERSDIVTVVMRVPDNFAPYVTPNTEAIFETPQLPGVKIHGRVTRFPPSLVNPERDRTMLVEVDLWNGPADEYKKKAADPVFLSGLKKGMPGDPRNGLPILPDIEGKLTGGRQQRLLPGMFGEMTLILRTFEDTHMLPSSAIVVQGGNSYIYVVQDGKARLQPVKVQVDDGRLVKVELLDAKGDVVGDLTGNEVVIISNQGELSDGQPVKPTVVADWRSQAEKTAAR